MDALPQVSRQVRTAAVIVGIVGIWGALIPFAGPSFGYGMGSSQSWQWSESHLTLHLAPGLAAVPGAALMLQGQRARQLFGATLAVLGGVWFVLAPTLHPLWATPSVGGMAGMGGSALSSALSGLGYHYGTGAVITIAAAYALGILSAGRVTADPLAHGAQRPGTPKTRERVGVRAPPTSPTS